MRVSGNAVRLAALVAAATASGYLWRAALESPSGTTIIRVAPRATPPRVQIVAAAHDPVTAPAPRSAAGNVTGRHQHARRPPAQVIRRIAAPAQTASFASSSRPATPPAAVPKPTPKPKPAPKPAPKPTTPSPPPPTQSQPPPVAAPATPTPPPSDTSASSTDQSGSTKPGWGNGDKNHDHEGPPGDKHGK